MRQFDTDDTSIQKAIESFNADNKGIKISFGSVGNILELKELINEFEDKFNVKALDDFYLEENKTYPDYGWYRKFEKSMSKMQNRISNSR